MGSSFLLLLRVKSIILDLEFLVGGIIWGATWCSATLAGVWQEIGNRNIGANILDNIVKRKLKRWLVCCFTCLLM